MQDYSNLSARQTAILLISILIVALCGIAYELIIGTVSSYLLGNSVYQFSLTIGLFAAPAATKRDPVPIEW